MKKQITPIFLGRAIPLLGLWINLMVVTLRSEEPNTPAGRTGKSEIMLANNSFSVGIDPTNGSVARIAQPGDPAAMNWVTSAAEAPWQLRSTQWGLGFADTGVLAMHRGRWEIPTTIESDSKTVRVVYRSGPLMIEVKRELVADALTECYIFTNTGKEPIRTAPASFAIYAPFNDNYTTAEDCLEHRMHAHIWCGGTSSWVCGLRMGGRAPHLGLVVTEGALKSYSVIGRDQVTSSNTRGVFLLHPEMNELAPGASATLSWTLFWHRGWDDFFAQCARRAPHFVRLQASRYVAMAGETVDIAIASTAELHDAKFVAGGQSVLLTGEGASLHATIRPTLLGQTHCVFSAAGNINTRLELNVVPAVDDLIAARAKFIVERQQVNTPGDPLEGAYLVYDNDRDALVRKDWGSDRNEARERIGMGVLLARWLRTQTVRDGSAIQSLERYYALVSEKPQRPDGTVLNGLGDATVRLYNYPWVMQLHLEMARLTGDVGPLRRFVRTAEKFYELGGDDFYAIGLPVLDGLNALKAADWKYDYDHLLANFRKHGAKIAARGLRYPAHEVNFEQSIVAPAAIFLLELYRATGEARWLESARPHLQCLELFGGRQPDHRLYEIAIRHWDGYWFGKARMWGDTFPHYWSTLTAVAFRHFGVIMQDKRYAERADEIIRGNLSLFSPDGRASCAYIYPLTVDGQAAQFADAYANDQDWALVHALQIAEQR